MRASAHNFIYRVGAAAQDQQHYVAMIGYLERAFSTNRSSISQCMPEPIRTELNPLPRCGVQTQVNQRGPPLAVCLSSFSVDQIG